jgi:4-amino-4-deoxy-L-arabinose transferase-like glycosyltransferase
VREIVRKHPRFFLAAAFAAIALRLLFVFRFPAITSDSFVYGDIAKNWLRHGNYGLGGGTEITPTCIRLPGYPAFLAAVFAVFGVEHYRAALLLQVFVDLGTCVLIADLARRLVSDRAAEAAFLLAALCPFLANYAAAALTETWEIFFTVLALDLAVVGVTSAKAWSVRPWLGCGLAIGTATLLRPDGGLLLIAVEIYLFALIARPTADERPQTAQLIKMASIVAVTFVACLVPWTLRNVRSLHQFQPLAPRYANDGNGFVPMGFIRWVKTWIADYASVEEVYWSVPSGPIDANLLPARAFDSPKQHEETARLIDGYNQSRQVTPDLDAGFAALAEERVHQAPLRYYISLPLLRIADMWLRPRTELLPCNTRWWEFDEDPQWLVLSVAIGIINLLYVGAALLGLVRRRLSFGFGMLLIFLFLRSMFLGTLENPEPRYTMECFPILILLAATLWQPRGNFIADGRSEIA